MIDLAELERMEKEATPSPWQDGFGGEPLCVGAARTVADFQDHHDQSLAVTLRNAAPQLIAIVKAAHDVTDCVWGTGKPGQYHSERMAKMDKLRVALEAIK